MFVLAIVRSCNCSFLVPADALALGRARQEVKEGWAKRRRERKAE
jgi:hypothetical protein